MRSAEYDIIIEQGATFQETFGWTQANGTPVNLTGMDFRMQIRPFKESDQILLAGAYDGGTNTPTGDIVFSETGAGGTFSIEIAFADTELLGFAQAFYDIEGEQGGDVIRIVEGKVTLSKEVTR